MKARWTSEAQQARDDIWLYVASDNISAAIRLDDLFDEAVDRLEEFPLSGREGLATGTREVFPHPNYRLVYAVIEGMILVLDIIHAARQWPPLPEDAE